MNIDAQGRMCCVSAVRSYPETTRKFTDTIKKYIVLTSKVLNVEGERILLCQQILQLPENCYANKYCNCQKIAMPMFLCVFFLVGEMCMWK